MSTIPHCDPVDSILQTELDKASAQRNVRKLRFVYTAQGSYLVVVLKSEPKRERFLTTRRVRNQPKVFIDQNRLLAELHKTWPQLSFEAGAEQLLPAAPAP